MTIPAWPPDAVIPKDAVIEQDVIIGARVILAGSGITLRFGCRLDAGSIVGDGVTIGQGAHLRAGAVALHSVPPNAIAEGNPARVVGYRNVAEGVQNPSAAPRHIDIPSVENTPRPGRIPLSVGTSALYLMRRITDARGSLTVGEVPAELPFMPARYFAVFGVPSQELRGEHAHKLCEQFLICLHGSCRVLLDDGLHRCEVTLDRPDVGVYMPSMIWGTQYRYSSDAVLLVFASRHYEADDYLRTYDEFLRERKVHA
ncbi:MAG: WxcM-like domain-containing protein [Pseudomonadota bacterium]